MGDESSNKNTLIYLFSTSILSCPKLDIQVDGVECRALVDSGAMANIIEVGLLTTKNIIKTDVNLVGANGSNLEVLGKVKKLIRVGKLSVMTDFFVCKKLETKCILGIPFLKQNRATLKFGEGKREVRWDLKKRGCLGVIELEQKAKIQYASHYTD